MINKDLWKNVKPVIERYARVSDSDLEMIEIVGNALCTIDQIDKNGDMF